MYFFGFGAPTSLYENYDDAPTRALAAYVLLSPVVITVGFFFYAVAFASFKAQSKFLSRNQAMLLSTLSALPTCAIAVTAYRANDSIVSVVGYAIFMFLLSFFNVTVGFVVGNQARISRTDNKIKEPHRS